MAIGAINSYVSPVQGYFNSDGNLMKYMTNLAAQKKEASKISTQYFNQPLINDLGKVGVTANQLRSQISGMASLNQYSSSIGKVASYSDKDVLSANVSKNAPVSSYTKTEVNVKQLASVQQNTSTALTATDNSFGSSFSMSITNSAGKTTSFNVNLTGADNNKSALQTMADRINASAAGVKASIVEDKDNGTVSLQLSGTKTGETDGKFTVTDDSAANLSNITADSKNAQYSVNGADFSTQSNDVKLLEGVTATLNKTGSTQVTYSQDVSSALNSVQNFINTYNSLKDAASSSDKLSSQLSGVAANYSRALSYSGIGMDSNGKLSITNENTLKQSISDGSFARNFQGVNSFGDRLNDVSRNAYRTAYDSAVQQSFKELMDQMVNSNNNANNWWQQTNTSLTSGLLFNMLI